MARESEGQTVPDYTPYTVLYHADHDGFCSAWIASKFLPDDTEYIAVQYGQEPPQVTDRNVYILDFSYARNVMEELIGGNKSLVCLDHHESAQRALSTLPGCEFGMNIAGCMMTWHHFIETKPREGFKTEPDADFDTALLLRAAEYAEDHDLYKFDLPFSKEIKAWLRSYPMTFEAWDELAARLHFAPLTNKDNPCDLILEGRAIKRAEDRHVESLLAGAYPVSIGGHRVLTVNTGMFNSQVGGALAEREGYPFGSTWFVRQDGKVVVSLRSRGEDGLNVARLAENFDGGGHHHAAGFEANQPPIRAE